MKSKNLLRLNEYLDVEKDKFEEAGVLNSLVEYDVPMYVNPKLLNKSKIEEFSNCETKIVKHFETTIKLLSRTNKKDLCWKALKKHFSFPEPSGIGLGSSMSSTNGRGLTGIIAENCLHTLKEIVDSGFSDPDIYKLLFLVQENLGVDRISDMICRIIYEDLILYTNNIIDKLNIKKYYIEDGIKKLKRPNGKDLILIPSEILSDIPDVLEHEDIVNCSLANEEIKEYLCEYFEKAYINVTDLNNIKVEDMKNIILGSNELIKKLLECSKTKDIKNYDFTKDNYALFDRLDSIISLVEEHKNELIPSKKFTDLKSLTEHMLDKYKFCIEKLGLNEEFYSDDRKNKIRREQVSHKLSIMVLDTTKEFCNFEYTYESKAGNGQIEFILFTEKEKILLEFKLTTNDLVHGYDKQLPEYISRFKSTYSFYVIIDVIGNYKLESFYKKKQSTLSNCSIFEIDATLKPSPSNL